MTVVLIAAALLCGVPIGFIVGILTGARMHRAAQDDIDYSGGV